MEFSPQPTEQSPFGSQYNNNNSNQSQKTTVETETSSATTMNTTTMELAYATLSLPPFASLNQIKSQYRRLALTNHPDKVQGNAGVKKAAHDQFARISAAYELLTCPELQRAAVSPILYAPFSDPYHLFNQSFAEGVPVKEPITISRNPISGYLMAAPPEPPKRVYEEISPPSSPITTATFMSDSDIYAPSAKRIKIQHCPPAPFLVRHSVKRDAWAIDDSSFDFVPSKRMRTSICT